jgi:hypothetical protein
VAVTVGGWSVVEMLHFTAEHPAVGSHCSWIGATGMTIPLTEKQLIVFGIVFIAVVLYGIIIRIIGQDRENRKNLLSPRKRTFTDTGPRAKELVPLV